MPVLPDEPNDEEKLEQLPEDGATPFRPADDLVENDQEFDDTHPVTDANVETEEVYEEGVQEAVETHEPNEGTAVLGYDPTKDQRRQQQDPNEH